ncbi:MAG TPA: alpha/beta hydrolase [Spirochaetales bacterium]|nr:alpha/beta hydrolase [Spirochaetales bacterium]HPS15226.1 alpha/beta hydrolase [Spirochaetales bacterium]
MAENGLWFTASDGKKLSYLKMLPSGPVKAVVVVGHGMNDHKERFLSLGQALAAIGLAVYMPDLRGHGDTDQTEDKGYLADTGGFERVLKDLVELGVFAVQEQSSVRGAPLGLYYFGHSFGALLGMALAGMYGERFAGIVLSAPPEKPDFFTSFFGRIIVWVGKHIKGPHAPGILPNTITFGGYAKTVKNARTKFDWLTRDSKIVDAYIADPKCNFVCSYGFYDDLMHGLSKVYGKGFLEAIPKSLPIYLFCGSEDPVIGKEAGFNTLTERFRALGLKDFEAKCYPGGRHESLNELARHEVLQDVTAWFAKHLA